MTAPRAHGGHASCSREPRCALPVPGPSRRPWSPGSTRRWSSASSATRSRRTSRSAPTSRPSPRSRRTPGPPATIAPRSPGVLAGVPLAAAVFDLVGRGPERRRRPARGGRLPPHRPGSPPLTVDRADPRPADRGAHRAEPGQPPVGDRDADPALGRRRRGDVRRAPRHPQDDAGPAGAGEVRRALRRRREPPDGPR